LDSLTEYHSGANERDGPATGAARTYMAAMVEITITPDAFAALAATLPLGSVAVGPERAPAGGVGIWLRHLRGPGESFSDAIMRLTEAHAGR
jgi:hypothetical protein